MKESVTYQAILEEGEEIGLIKGKLQEARRLIVRAGTKRFGEAPAAAASMLEEIASLESLEALLDRIFEVETWEEWLV